jgi:hypothetical protein
MRRKMISTQARKRRAYLDIRIEVLYRGKQCCNVQVTLRNCPMDWQPIIIISSVCELGIDLSQMRVSTNEHINERKLKIPTFKSDSTTLAIKILESAAAIVVDLIAHTFSLSGGLVYGIL